MSIYFHPSDALRNRTHSHNLEPLRLSLLSLVLELIPFYDNSRVLPHVFFKRVGLDASFVGINLILPPMAEPSLRINV